MATKQTTQFKFEDICDAMEAIELETGGKLVIELERYAGKAGRQRVAWTALLTVRVGPQKVEKLFLATQGWPTHTHRTVLGLVWSLLHKVHQEAEAANHLAQM